MQSNPVNNYLTANIIFQFETNSFYWMENSKTINLNKTKFYPFHIINCQSNRYIVETLETMLLNYVINVFGKELKLQLKWGKSSLAYKVHLSVAFRKRCNRTSEDLLSSVAILLTGKYYYDWHDQFSII